jgi:hypothetical protein
VYIWIWRHLPGSRLQRLVQLAVLVLAVLAACLRWGFPWIDSITAGQAATLG